MAPQVPFVPPAQRVMVEDSKPATPRALPQLPPQLRGMDIPPDLMDQLLYEQSANPFGVGASRALVRDALAMKAPGEVAPKLYALDDAQLVVTLGSKEAGAEELFNEQRPLIVESLRRAYVQMMIGQWYQVIDLRHPTPASAPAPYGAWLGAAYQEASDKRMRLHPSLIDAVQKSRQAVDPGT